MPKVNTERNEKWGKNRKNTTWTKGNPGKRTMSGAEVRRASKPAPFAPKKKG